MGNTIYNDDFAQLNLRRHKAQGTDVFTYDAELRAKGEDLKVHPKLDPKWKAGEKSPFAGEIVRESRDSEEHKESVSIAVIFDTTGSMRHVPRTFIQKLPNLMGLLIKKNYIENPQILFGAIGDANYDRVPLQIGQFESGNEMDEALSLIVLEGGGGTGPHRKESYELAMYYLAEHAKMDCLEKRNKKGYCFFIGDELPYNPVEAKKIYDLIGDKIESDIPTEKILEKLQDKFEVFWITPAGTLHWNRKEIIEPIKDMFGQNYIRLENPADVCEVIATTIAISEGHKIEKVMGDLRSIGSDFGSIERAGQAVINLSEKTTAK